MLSVIGSVTRGLGLGLRGLGRSLKSKAVRRAYLALVLTLLAVTIVLEIVGIQLLLHFTAESSPIAASANAIDPEGVAWYEGALTAIKQLLGDSARWVIRVLGIVVLTLVAPVIATTLVNLVVPMFNDRLFMTALDQIDPERRAELETSDGRSILVNLVLTLRRLLRFALTSAGVMLIGFVPLIGPPIAVVLQSWFSARAIAWELLDPYFERLRLGYREQLQFLRAHAPCLFGFGFPFAYAMAIPIVGPLGFGLAQSSAASLTRDIETRVGALAIRAPG